MNYLKTLSVAIVVLFVLSACQSDAEKVSKVWTESLSKYSVETGMGFPKSQSRFVDRIFYDYYCAGWDWTQERCKKALDEYVNQRKSKGLSVPFEK